MLLRKKYSFGLCENNPKLGYFPLLLGWAFNGKCNCGCSIAYDAKPSHKIKLISITGPKYWTEFWSDEQVKKLNKTIK